MRKLPLPNASGLPHFTSSCVLIVLSFEYSFAVLLTMTSSSVAAQIGFERNTIWNPEYIYDRHKPVALDEFISDKEWQTFVHDIDNTLKPAEKFQKGAKVRITKFLLQLV